MEPLAKDEREAVAASLYGIVRHMARVRYKYAEPGSWATDFDECVGECGVGLARALNKFDKGRGTKPSTVAVWWIKDAITRRERRDKATKRQAKVARFSELPGKDLEAEAFLSPEPSPDQTAEAEEEIESLRRAVAALPDGPRSVVSSRLDGVPFAEIGMAAGKSLTWARETYLAAIEDLRRAVLAAGRGAT